MRHGTTSVSSTCPCMGSASRAQAPRRAARMSRFAVDGRSVIARVAWAKGHRAGLRSQDPIFIRALISNEDVEATLPPPAAGRPVERRHTSRPTSKAHDDSRVRGRIIEFASFAVIVAALGFAAVSTVSEALEQPLSAVRLALDPGPSKVLQKAPGSPDHARIWHLSESLLQRSHLQLVQSCSVIFRWS